jgi:hypothetical protein
MLRVNFILTMLTHSLLKSSGRHSAHGRDGDDIACPADVLLMVFIVLVLG